MALKLMENDDIIRQKEIRFLMTGGMRTENKRPMPAFSNPEIGIWFNKVVWTKIEELDETIEQCHGLAATFAARLDE